MEWERGEGGERLLQNYRWVERRVERASARLQREKEMGGGSGRKGRRVVLALSGRGH